MLLQVRILFLSLTIRFLRRAIRRHVGWMSYGACICSFWARGDLSCDSSFLCRGFLLCRGDQLCGTLPLCSAFLLSDPGMLSLPYRTSLAMGCLGCLRFFLCDLLCNSCNSFWDNCNSVWDSCNSFWDSSLLSSVFLLSYTFSIPNPLFKSLALNWHVCFTAAALLACLFTALVYLSVARPRNWTVWIEDEAAARYFLRN